jgi:epoxyqueuosine reductase QueG
MEPIPYLMQVEKIIKKHLPEDEEFIWGYADLTGIIHERFIYRPFALVIGLKMDDRLIDQISEGPTKEYFEYYVRSMDHLDEIAYAIEKDLKTIGFDTEVQQASAPNHILSKNYEETIRSDFSHKMAATNAGFGWIGRTDLLISFKWGPRVWLITILADKPMGPPGNPITESQCGDCKLCVIKCPPHAVTGQKWDTTVDRNNFFDPWKCREYCNKITKERTGYEGPSCGICVNVCPKGKKLKNDNSQNLM